MRTWILGMVLGAIVTLPAMAAAQSAAGVRAGMRWSELETSHEAGSISGLALGAYYGFAVSDRLAIQFEVVYGRRGAESLRLGADELDPEARPTGLEMSYIEVPLLLRTGYPGDRFMPSFFLGPYVAFLLDCELQPSGADTRSCDADGAAQRFNPRGRDFGLVLGAGLDVAMGESTVFLDGRFTLGLLSIEEGDDAFDARHSGLAVTAGFAVPVGR